MFEQYGGELMMLGGTLAGFIAALLTVMEKLLDVQTRLQTKPYRAASPPPEPPVGAGSAIDSTSEVFSAKSFRGSSYLLLYETSVIAAAGFSSIISA